MSLYRLLERTLSSTVETYAYSWQDRLSENQDPPMQLPVVNWEGRLVSGRKQKPLHSLLS